MVIGIIWVSAKKPLYKQRHNLLPWCRATRRFQPNGGVERTERMLKWWLLQGSSLASHKAHLDLPFPDPASLPTFQELDALLACAQ